MTQKVKSPPKQTQAELFAAITAEYRRLRDDIKPTYSQDVIAQAIAKGAAPDLRSRPAAIEYLLRDQYGKDMIDQWLVRDYRLDVPERSF